MSYPYLFQTSGFLHIDAIRAELESQGDWDYASNANAKAIIEETAAKFGFNHPYNPEQLALFRYLRQKRAGLHICTYAWGLYAESQEAQIIEQPAHA